MEPHQHFLSVLCELGCLAGTIIALVQFNHIPFAVAFFAFLSGIQFGLMFAMPGYQQRKPD